MRQLALLVAVITLAVSAPAADIGSLLRQRLETARAVAMAKFNSASPIEDKVREKQVIDSAVHMGANMGVDADLVVRVFSAQIEASKIAQRALQKRWLGRTHFDSVPNLAKTIRPILDRLTPEILECLKSKQYWTRRELGSGPKDPIYRQSWEAAIKPLLPLSKAGR